MEWIRVKDKLPELYKNDESDNVLVFTDDHGVLVASMNFYPKGGYRKEDSYTWSEHATGCGCCGEYIEPTHWMRLPNPPEGE